MQQETTFAGFGGQGILLIGQLLAQAGMAEGREVAWIPSYGPEMRGGTAYCTVVISDMPIGSPIIKNPAYICVLNRPSLDKFGPIVKKGGILCINTSLIDAVSGRTDITEVLVPANDIALKGGSAKSANIAVLGAYLGSTGIVPIEAVRKAMRIRFSGKDKIIKMNLSILKKGYELGLRSKRKGKSA